MIMTINANTKIAAILKQSPMALDAIISINPKFEKLRNPFLRKIMASRTSLATASKFGGCTVDDFFRTLEPLGFKIDREAKVKEESIQPVPAFITGLDPQNIVDLDVRPVLASGTDPLQLILGKVKSIQPGQALRIINTFEPTPLISMLGKKGFDTYVDRVGPEHIETYFYKTGPVNKEEENLQAPNTNDWNHNIKKFEGNLVEIDVRSLEMPKPMLNILEALDNLPEGKALFVYHKRIPVFLLPELDQKGFEYRVKEISDGEVHMLIFRK